MKAVPQSARQDLTEKQMAVYVFIKDEIVQQRLSPTVREIGEQFNIRSSNGVLAHLRALERKGWIKRDHYLSRGISLIPEALTQLVTLEPGESFVLGEMQVRCVGDLRDSSKVTLELTAPDTLGKFSKDV